MLPSVPRALILALALIAPWPVVAAAYTPEDVVQAVEREFPEETIVLMIEGQEWHLDDEATMRLLRSGVPPKYVALMLGDDGLSVDELEAMAAARAHEIEGMSGSFCVVTTHDGEKYRGQILAATATSVVLVQVDDSVRVLPRATVIAATSARATLREWRSRVGKQTFVSLANGEIVNGELVAAEEDVLVLRRTSGKFRTIPAEDVAALVLSPPGDRGDVERAPPPRGRTAPARDSDELARADAADDAEDDDSATRVEPHPPVGRGAPQPNKNDECPWSYGPNVWIVEDSVIVDGKDYPIRSDAERLEFARVLRACDADAAIPMLEARAGGGALIGIGVVLLVLGIVTVIFLSIIGGAPGGKET